MDATTGDVLDPGDAVVQPSGPIPIGFANAGTERTPAVAWDGSRFAVAWNDARGRQGDPAIAGSMVSTAMVVQPPAVWLGMGFIVDQPPALACNDAGQCAVVSGDYTTSSALGRAIVKDGGATTFGTLINRSSSFPGVASIGTSFLVVYNDGLTPSVLSVMLDPAGALASTPRPLAMTGGARQAATATASEYLAVWQLGTQLEYNVLDPAGLILGSTRTIPGTDNRSPSAASSATVSLVVWIEAGTRVRAARIAVDGTLLDPTPLSISNASSSTRPAVTWDGVSFLVVCEQMPAPATGYLAVVAVDPDTGAVGPETPLTAAASPPIDIAPALASDGSGTSLCAFQRDGASKAIYALSITR